MEPFALFQILQTLLNSQEKKGDDSPVVEPKETPPPPSAEKEVILERNAAADFLEAHAWRASRTKRK